MKLNNYIKKEETSYAALAKKMGSISSTALYRYGKGLRRPSQDIASRIEKATQGKVTARDFKHIRKTKKVEYRITAQNKIKALEISWHLNGRLESEFTFAVEKESAMTLPVSIAFIELKERAYVRKGKYYLDGRPTSISALISTANRNRERKGLVKIAYPGCL